MSLFNILRCDHFPKESFPRMLCFQSWEGRAEASRQLFLHLTQTPCAAENWGEKDVTTLPPHFHGSHQKAAVILWLKENLLMMTLISFWMYCTNSKKSRGGCFSAWLIRWRYFKPIPSLVTKFQLICGPNLFLECILPNLTLKTSPWFHILFLQTLLCPLPFNYSPFTSTSGM